MASSNADFGQRIICSARSLISTFSSVPETLDDLGSVNPLFAKQTLVTAQLPEAVIPTDFSRSLSSSVSASQSVRSAPGPADFVEDDYQDFVTSSAVALPKTGVDDGEWIRPGENEQWERLWTRKYTPSKPELRRANTTPIWKRASTGKVVYSSSGTPEWSWEHEWRRINKHLLREESKKERQAVGGIADFMINSAVNKLGLDYDRPSPLARLLQVKQHLVSTGEEEETKWPQDWDMAQHGRCDWNVDDQCQREQESWYFSCDRNACHHTLLRANENLTLEISQRVCVHENCAYVSDTVESWLRHITSPHHKVQNSTERDEEEKDQSGHRLDSEVIH